MALLARIAAPGFNLKQLLMAKCVLLPVLAFLLGGFVVEQVFSLDGSHSPYPTKYEESEIKAAYLYKLLKFIDWPEQALSPANAPVITIGVLGGSPVFGFLQSMQQSQTAFQTKVTRLTGEEIFSVKVLFISESENEKPILSRLKGNKILTFSDKKNFVDAGGMIGFVLVDNRVKFEVNMKTMNEAGFKMSGNALSAAYRVLK